VTARGTLAALGPAIATPELRRVQVGWACSSVAGWGLMVVLSIYAFDRGGAAAVGLAAVARLVPGVLAAPLAGSLADRLSRRRVLLAAAGGRISVLGGLALLAAADAPLWATLALAALYGALSTAHRPAQSALLPGLARTPDQLAAANAVLSAVDNGGFLVGSLLGGTLTAVAGPAVAFAVMGAVLAVAAVALAGLAHDRPPPPLPSEHRISLARELAAGAQTVFAVPELRLVLGLFALATVVEGVADVFIVVAAFELLGVGEAGVGHLNAAWGLGGIVGGVLAASVLGRGRLAAGVGAGCSVVAAAFAVFAAWPVLIVALAMLLALGVGYAFVEVGEAVLVQRLVAGEALARAVGVSETLYVAATAAGSLVAPAVLVAAGRWGIVGLCAALALATLALWPRLARLADAVPVPERPFELLRGVPFLAPLPLAGVENLARHVSAVPIAAGEIVIRQGEPGDSFYVIADGEVRVDTDGADRRVEGPGEFFGEIALLRDVPRTATVTATRPGLLFALDRQAFLAAVNGLPRSRHGADAVVSERWR